MITSQMGQQITKIGKILPICFSYMREVAEATGGKQAEGADGSLRNVVKPTPQIIKLRNEFPMLKNSWYLITHENKTPNRNEYQFQKEIMEAKKIANNTNDIIINMIRR